MWRGFSRLYGGATSLRAFVAHPIYGVITAKTLRPSQTTTCPCKQLLLTSPSSSLREISSRRRRVMPRASWRPPWRPARRRGAAAAAALVPASCLRLPLLHSTSCVAAGSAQPPPSVTPRRALPEGLRAPRPPTRRKAVVWSVRRPRPAETRCAARALRSRRPCRRPRTAERTPRERPRGHRERRDAERERITAPTPTQT